VRVVLKHEVNRVKNGFAASCPALGVTAHGHSPEVARKNLERTALLFLRPFERQGVLEEELATVPVVVEQGEGELTVITAE
jgi:predicted RNase H-like HicB family nuclease